MEKKTNWIGLGEIKGRREPGVRWIVVLFTNKMKADWNLTHFTFDGNNPLTLTTKGKILIDKLHNTRATLRLVFGSTTEAWDFVQKLVGDDDEATYIGVWKLYSGSMEYTDYEQGSILSLRSAYYRGILDCDTIDVEETDKRSVKVSLSFGDFNPLKTVPFNLSGPKRIISVKDAVAEVLKPLELSLSTQFSIFGDRAIADSYIDPLVLGVGSTMYDLLELCSEALGASLRQINGWVEIINATSVLENNSPAPPVVNWVVNPAVKSIGSSYNYFRYELINKEPAGARAICGEVTAKETPISQMMGFYNNTPIGGYAYGEAVEYAGYSPYDKKNALRWRYNLSDDYKHGIVLHEGDEVWQNDLPINSILFDIYTPLNGSQDPITLKLEGERLILGSTTTIIETERKFFQDLKDSLLESNVNLSGRSYGLYALVRILNQEGRPIAIYGGEVTNGVYNGNEVERVASYALWGTSTNKRLKIPLGDIFSETFRAEVTIPMPKNPQWLKEGITLAVGIMKRFDNGLQFDPNLFEPLSLMLKMHGVQLTHLTEADMINWFFRKYFGEGFRDNRGARFGNRASHYRVLTSFSLGQGEQHTRPREVNVALRANNLEELTYEAHVGSTPNTGTYLHKKQDDGTHVPLYELPELAPKYVTAFGGKTHEYLVLHDLILLYKAKTRVFTFETYSELAGANVVSVDGLRCFGTRWEHNVYTGLTAVEAESMGSFVSDKDKEAIEESISKKIYYHTGATSDTNSSGGRSSGVGAGRRGR